MVLWQTGRNIDNFNCFLISVLQYIQPMPFVCSPMSSWNNNYTHCFLWEAITCPCPEIWLGSNKLDVANKAEILGQIFSNNLSPLW